MRVSSVHSRRQAMLCVFTTTLLSLLSACGGGGGGGSGGGSSGNIFTNDARGKDFGTGQPLKLELTHVRQVYNPGTTYALTTQSLPEDKVGYFRGRPPAPPASGGSSNPYWPDTLSINLLYSSRTGPMGGDLGSVSAGETITDFYPALGLSLDHNLLALAASETTPEARARLIIREGSQPPNDVWCGHPNPDYAQMCYGGPPGEILCDITGTLDELMCLAEMQPPHPLHGYHIQVEAIDDIDDLTLLYEGDVSDRLRNGLTTSNMIVVPEDYRDSNSILEVNAFSNGEYSHNVEYMLFVYFPDHDVTVFFPAHALEHWRPSGSGSGSSRILRLALSRGGSSPTLSMEDGIRLARTMQGVEIQAFFGDVPIDTVLSGHWPGRDARSKWSQVQQTGIIPRQLSSGGGGGGSTDVDGLGGSRVSYTFTCPTPGSQPVTVQVTSGACRTAQQQYSRAHVCNDLNNFGSTCQSLYSCAVNNSSGAYTQYYQNFLSGCY